jgi:hypothetical protein
MRRKQIVRSHGGSVSAHDIEALRRAIQAGFPWLLHTEDRTYRRSGLTLAQGVLLSYITGIAAGAAVFLAGNPHPSRKTVASVKGELKDEIAEAEKRFKSIFKGQRRSYDFFRYEGPQAPKRKEF